MSRPEPIATCMDTGSHSRIYDTMENVYKMDMVSGPLILKPFWRRYHNGPRGCTRIAIFFKIKACSKNYRRHIVDISRIIF